MIANNQYPDISVILPTYKPGEYIAQCIRSIGSQTLPKERYSVIIVLNGCREPYLTYINKALRNCPEMNVTVVQTDVAGVSNARNMALDRVESDFVTFLDDDDWVSENYLESLLKCAVCDGITQANLRAVDDVTGEERPHYVSKAYEKLAAGKALNVVNARSFLSAAWCKLIPKDVIGGERFDNNCTQGEDSLFMFAVSKRIKSIKLAPADALYYVRIRESSASRQRFGYAERCRLAWKLIVRFTSVWLADVPRYNFVLYLTRIMATARRYLLP